MFPRKSASISGVIENLGLIMCVYTKLDEARKPFMIQANDCLSRSVKASYHCDYVGYQKPGNPDYINHLKNQFGNSSSLELRQASDALRTVLHNDWHEQFSKLQEKVTVCVIPRAKAEASYSSNQLLFKNTIKDFISGYDMLEDGTGYITRIRNTRTTHMKNYDTDGEMPYKGITKETCDISQEVAGKKILLIDDIYTKTVNIDEDAIQALYDNGAREVIFYSVGRTISRY